jgi:Protein of unknown function (DUF2971)
MSLYKYLRSERIDVLERLQIRFSPAISTNDAFELRPLTNGWASRETAEKILVAKFKDFFLQADTPERMLQVAITNHPEAETNFRKTMEILGPEKWFRLMKDNLERSFDAAATGVHDLVEQQWGAFLERFTRIVGTQIGILSLSEDPRNPVMWGHYSDCSRGFVVGFDETHPWFSQKRTENDEFCHLRKVTYVKDNCPKYFSELTGQDIGYSKLDGWSYEKEWRILFPLERGINTKLVDSFGQPIIVFPFPPECLTEVIVGSRAAEELHQQICLACEKLPSHIPISKGTW